MRVTDSFLNEIRARNDIAALVSMYTELERTGSGYVCKCPFHQEEYPSFHIFSDTGTFRCFSCGASGDVISFMSFAEHCGTAEAVTELAERVELELTSDEDEAQNAAYRRMLDINRDAARYYRDVLLSPTGKPGMEYLLGRELTLGTIRKYGLGFAPAGWHNLHHYLKKMGYSEKEMEEAALIVRHGTSVYDKFRSRVMFPIINKNGDVIGFGGRTLEKTAPAKYINTDETLVFHKRENLFSLNYAKSVQNKRFILCEGYMDVITMNQAGFEGAVATLGTAITPQQAKLIKQHCEQVVISYDSDEAGQKAAAKAIKLFKDTGLDVRVLLIPGAKDPDEYIGKYGAVSFEKLLDSLPTADEYEFSKLVNAANGDKTGITAEIIGFLARLNSSEREKYILQLRDMSNVTQSADESDLDDAPDTTITDKPVSELTDEDILKRLKSMRRKKVPTGT
ncbi:MAG: DNA primase [Ruminiclostridium sp.]|nr:DNA primase [Ruminiclostridium sp.]